MCEAVNMDQAASEFLRAVRGRRSQLALARRLGYRSNPVANWETGRRFPTAREALRVCRRVRIDVAGSFARFLPAAAADRDVERDLAGWLRDVKGKAAIGNVAERSGLSRFAVSRFLRGSAEPRLPDFLRLVEAMTGRASDLVAELVPIERVPSLAPGHRLRQAARDLAFEEPWTEAILRALECAEGRARATASWIAVELGLSRGEAQRCLDKLEAAQLVQAAEGAYRAIGSLTVDTKAAAARTRSLNAHWGAVALARMSEPRPDDLFAYNVFSVAESDLERIRGVLRASFREIRAIVASSERNERVALMNLQLMRLG
jgi:transcriptional regulator with XRE-family HTH domain